MTTSTQTHWTLWICISILVFLTSVACLSCVATVTLAVHFAQAWHSTFAMFAAGQATGAGRILVLLITKYASKARLAAAGVGVGVDREAGTMNTPAVWRRRDRTENKDVDVSQVISWIQNVDAVLTMVLSSYKSSNSKIQLTCCHHKDC